MSSLNSGYELDNNVIGVKEVEEGQQPPQPLEDLAGSEDTLVAIESGIIDLSDLADSIQEAGGMSQDFAMEALRIVPGVLSATPKHFSMSPTATRLKISLEEIHAGVWALIAAAVAAVIAIIYKIYRWISGDSTDGEKGDSGAAFVKAEKSLAQDAADVKDYAEATAETEDAIKRGSDLMRQGIELSDAGLQGLDKSAASAAQQKKIRYTDFDHLIAKLFVEGNKFEAAKRFLESGDPYFHDVITYGAYTKMAEDAGDALLLLKSALETKVRALDELIKEDINSTSATAQWKHNQTLDNDVIKKPIELTFRGQKMDMEGVAKALRIQKEGVGNQHPTERINFNTLFQRTSSIYKKPVNIKIFQALRESMVFINALESKIEHMQSKTANVNHDGHPGSGSEGVAVRVREALHALLKDVYGYGHLAHELKFYAMNVNYLAKEAQGFGTAVVLQITKALKHDGERVPDEWQAVLRDLQTQLEHLRDVYQKSRRRT